jgi:cytochrome b involved in lipid metabolism
MSTKILGIAGLLAVAAFAAAFFLRTPDAAVQPSAGVAAVTAPASRAQASAAAGAPSPAGYSLADVAAHNSASSCWTAINGKVYDVTSWIGRHPGGRAAILSLCGTDGSAAFNGQHGGQARPEAELATFYIAPLTQ